MPSTPDSSSGQFVILFEPDARFEAPVREALRAINGKIELLSVTDEDAFLKALRKEHPALKDDSLVPLALFPVTAGIALHTLADRISPQKLPVLIATTFEHSAAMVKTWATAGVFNLLQKPYDPLLLRQHLKIALNPNEAPQDFTTHNMKTSALIEMLKEIPMEALSEVGVVTRSDREVPLGRVIKLYGRVFEWNEKLSLFVKSIDQRPHPKNKGDKSVFMTWFGVGRDQLLKIRSRFPKEPMALDWGKSAENPAPVHFCILGDPSPPGSEIEGTLTRGFANLNVMSFAALPGPQAALPQEFRAVFFHRGLKDQVLSDPRFKKAAKVVITSTNPRDAELREDAETAVEVLPLPLERASLIKRILLLFPDLRPVTKSPIQSFPWIEKLDVGQPIEISELSEAGLTMKYERALPVGTIRRFVLWQPVEAGLPVTTARCYLSRADSKGNILNYFVFFGMSDAEIKYIRVWMRDQFIHAKTKSQ